MNSEEADEICVKAVRHITGSGMPIDPAKAAELFQSVADEGYSQGFFGLAELKMMGVGIEKDVEEAIELYEKAQEMGNLSSAFRLGNIYWSGEHMNHDRSFMMFGKCCEGGFEYAYNNMGDCYYYSVGTDKDVEKAIEWYSKAAGAGDPSAMFKLGCIYDMGGDVERNPAMAFAMFRHAAEGGIPEAQFKLASLAYDGETDGGLEEAAEWYGRCMDSIPVAKFNLATMYYSGIGVEEDREKAFGMYRELADAGDADAMFQVGRMYLEGEGVGKDEEAALRYFSRSAGAGNEQAHLVVEAMLRQQNAQFVEIKTE